MMAVDFLSRLCGVELFDFLGISREEFLSRLCGVELAQFIGSLLNFQVVKEQGVVLPFFRLCL